VKGLPPESTTARLLGAPKPGDWTNTEELLAATVNELRASRYLFVRAHVKKGTSVPEPTMIRRPGAVRGEDRKRPATAEELARALGKGPGVIRYTPRES